mgnify:CR=1 FL=1
MVERLNSELANTLGNLVNRTISMSNKYFGGLVENKVSLNRLMKTSKHLHWLFRAKLLRRWTNCVLQMQ